MNIHSLYRSHLLLSFHFMHTVLFTFTNSTTFRRHVLFLKRFDLLAGFNGMEGGIYIAAFLEPYLQALNKVVTNGCSLADMRSLLTGIICPRFFTSQAPELCAEFIIDTYNMVGSTNDTERVIQFIKFGGLSFIICCVYWE